MKLSTILCMLSNNLNHPLGCLDRLGTLARIVRWQLGSRLVGAPVAVPFVNDTRLLVSTSMHGATGNIYVGLMEFEDMAFVLHLLSQDDNFIDVGANVGVYSILAASRGARVLAMEPVPASYQHLLDNIYLNRFQNFIEPKNIGVGGQAGSLFFSTSMGATNRVLADDEVSNDYVNVPVHRLDEIAPVGGGGARMLKIDVEGFEAEVIRGAGALLKEDSLQAVLIELNKLGLRYGFSDADIHARLLEFDFRPVRYEPFSRRLVPLDRHRNSGNTLYVRPSDSLYRQLQHAPAVIWGKIQI